MARLKSSDRPGRLAPIGAVFGIAVAAASRAISAGFASLWRRECCRSAPGDICAAPSANSFDCYSWCRRRRGEQKIAT